MVPPSSQDLQTSGCTEVHRRRSARPTPSPFSTGTAQTLGEHKERPAPSSAVPARVRSPDSSSPVLSSPLPAMPAQRCERSHCCHTPLPPNTNTRGLFGASPKPGRLPLRCSARASKPGGRPPTPPVPPPADPGACGGSRALRHRRRGPASARTRRTGRGGGNGAGEGGTRRAGNSHGRRTALPLRDRHRRHPARRIASRNNSPARPATPAAARTHTPPARAPGHARTHPRPDTRTRTHTDTDTRGRAPAPLPVTVGGGAGGRRGSARSVTVTGAPGNGRPAARGPRPPAPPPRDSLRRLWMSSEWLAPPDFQAIARHTLRSRYRAAFSAATAHSSFPRKDTTSSADTGAASSPPPPAAAAAAAAARSPRGGATRPPPRAADMPRPPPPPPRRPARCPPRACAPTAPGAARGEILARRGGDAQRLLPTRAFGSRGPGSRAGGETPVRPSPQKRRRGGTGPGARVCELRSSVNE